MAAERGAEDAGAEVADGDGDSAAEIEGLEARGAPVAEAHGHGSAVALDAVEVG